MRRLPYPDDLSDKEWSLLEKYIELDYSKGGRKPIHEKRNYLDAIFYWLRTGCGWRHLPHDFSPWIRIRYFEIPKYKYQGLVFGDKGYICKKLFDELYQKGLKLITRYRKNMKNKLALNEYDKQLLNQRNLVETVIDHLKHYYQVWHTRHRSILNAVTHLVSALAAYTVEPLKLSAIKLIAKTHN